MTNKELLNTCIFAVLAAVIATTWHTYVPMFGLSLGLLCGLFANIYERGVE